MRKYNIDILGIGECRCSRFGKMKLNSGETIYLGREDGSHRSGVAMMMSKRAESALIEWVPVNERIIKARFHSKYIKLTVIQVYAPTMESEEEEVDQFYNQLQSVLQTVRKRDM